MAKAPKRFVCTSCGNVAPRWTGQCPSCAEWNTLIEDTATGTASIAAKAGSATKGRVIRTNRLDAEVVLPPRLTSGIGELDSVLGGGLVHGSVSLISGEPGIGKSTLLLQATAAFAKKGNVTLYVSGEEHEDQVRLRAQRLGLGDAPVELGHETAVRDVIATAAAIGAKVLVVDSIQTMRSDAVEGASGGVAQIKSCGDDLIAFAKSSGCSVIIVGHVTKGGDLAGPRALEHMVDAVLSFEGDRSHQFRLLRAVKNRFGATDEVGVFEMAEKGLREVVNPSSLFLVDREQETTGTCVVPTIEGGRSILVEVQALVIKRTQEGGYAKRACVGWDKNRLDMILALLEARYGMPFSQADVYLNVAGGYRLDDPGTDMAVACAVMSAFLDKPMPRGMVAFGELALSGDVRPVAYMGLRIREAAKLGFESAWCPRLPDDASPSKGFQAKQTRGFHEIVNVLLGKS
jgi:DNA repair protein RadA/Sms